MAHPALRNTLDVIVSLVGMVKQLRTTGYELGQLIKSIPFPPVRLHLLKLYRGVLN